MAFNGLYVCFSGCQFPKEWEGIWFQSTVRPYITIEAPRGVISTKGHCAKADLHGEKFLLKVYVRSTKLIKQMTFTPFCRKKTTTQSTLHK